MRNCPACGAQQVLQVRRIRCASCGRRIPANVLVCPHCGHNPRGLYLQSRVLYLFAAIVLIALAVLAFPRVIPWYKGISVASAPPRATHTPGPTLVEAMAITAAVPAELPTTEVPPSPEPSDVPTLMPSPVPTTAPTDVPTPTWTATQVLVLWYPPPKPTLTPSPYPAAELISPLNGAIFYGRGNRIMLTFQSDLQLAADQWFRVEVLFNDRSNNVAGWCGWSKGDPVRFPNSYFDDSWQTNRVFRWHVQLVTAADALPSTCQAAATNLGPPSAEWTFRWE